MNFSVTIQPTGQVMQVNEGETLLDAALRQSIGLPYGCRSGLCGSCLCSLESGQVDYPDGPSETLRDKPTNALLSCQAVPRSDLLIQVPELLQAQDFEVKTLPCKVHSLERIAHDVVRLQLKLPEGDRLQFQAGQYLNVILADGRKRAFSLANAPHDDAFIELHVRHVEGGQFTDYVFAQMQPKALLRIEAPLGGFTLRESSERPMIFVAGGTGFAPIKGIIEHIIHIGDPRPLQLYWGAHAERDLYLRPLAEQWQQEHSQMRFIPVLSEPDPDWAGRSGWVHQAVLADNPDLSGFDVYMAGPPPMIQAAKQGFEAAGLDLARLYSDSFEYGAAADKT
ncbi:MAG: CDP-6-deoxy-delta-3,4-glucoseen reductase [Gammaproteobacteria bacterium SHHR-1]|uniref:CDP-6-deoxy-delta-3,4-glucoseen reductase n=1 Tax=Magnetovirga frankeli TaxID=947516 RepID=UPI001293A9A0|nr:CDP-6-deoxy-delta-3,4-glucoseen reductase [gamma proteobacterium SS-5]